MGSQPEHACAIKEISSISVESQQQFQIEAQALTA
jgi:hypothetical protein